MADNKQLWIGGYGSRRVEEPADGMVAASLSRWTVADDGSLTFAHNVGGVSDSSYVIRDAASGYLFAVQESGRGGRFLIVDPQSDQTEALAAVEIGAGGPCHLAVHGGWVFTANYGSGSVSCLQLTDDRRSAKLVAVIQHTGSSVNRQRQEAPHAHWVGVDARAAHLYAVDLGTDLIVRYPLAALLKRLSTHAATSDAPPTLDYTDIHHDAIVLPAGEGPRHIAFGDCGRYAYVVTELGNRVFALDLDTPLPEAQDCGLAGGVEGAANQPAAIRLSPCGGYLATSVRGSDYIGVFKLGEGRAEQIQNLPCGGVWPRDLLYAQDGRTLWCANENSHEITAFRVAEDGTLSGGDVVARISSPACLLELGQ